MRAPTICAAAGCPEAATRRGRCATHQPAAWKNQSPSSAALSRSAAHKRERRTARQRADGRCEGCGRKTSRLALHHPHPIADGGDIVQKDARLLCDRCHRDEHTA